MKIMLARNWLTYLDLQVQTYAISMARALRELGHEVIEIPKVGSEESGWYNKVDFLIDVDCGRDSSGEQRWHGAISKPKGCVSVLFLIDSHGNPSLHRRLSKNYDHVFFAVWDKRDLFTGHNSAHWCPNFTDLKWFDGTKYPKKDFVYDFGFFGSKGGLDRAGSLLEIALRNNWIATARQINVGNKHRWPRTAECMAECRYLFNKGQKHDSPNLRVMESMLMLRPLISDRDQRSGMDKLFVEGKHYIGYDYFTWDGLEDAMAWMMKNPSEAEQMALNAYVEVAGNHLVEHRVKQILEVIENES